MAHGGRSAQEARAGGAEQPVGASSPGQAMPRRPPVSSPAGRNPTPPASAPPERRIPGNPAAHETPMPTCCGLPSHPPATAAPRPLRGQSDGRRHEAAAFAPHIRGAASKPRGSSGASAQASGPAALPPPAGCRASCRLIPLARRAPETPSRGIRRAARLPTPDRPARRPLEPEARAPQRGKASRQGRRRGPAAQEFPAARLEGGRGPCRRARQEPASPSQMRQASLFFSALTVPPRRCVLFPGRGCVRSAQSILAPARPSAQAGCHENCSRSADAKCRKQDSAPVRRGGTVRAEKKSSQQAAGIERRANSQS